jgi:hypothetical protein
VPSRRMLAVVVPAAAILGLGVNAALAGEVTGPPGGGGKPTQGPIHANSVCSFSGQNDFVNGPTDFIVQSFGQDVRLGHISFITGQVTDPHVSNPGDSCRGGEPLPEG